MRSKPAKFMLLIPAILGLSFSAIAACACTHHQPEIRSETVSSCHGTSHEQPQPEQTEAVQNEDSADTHCECRVAIGVPVIAVKTEIKRVHPTVDSIESSQTQTFELRAISTARIRLHSVPDRQFYKLAFLRSGPSRAPPRQ